MKILFISLNAPGLSVGGIERHIKNLIGYCCQNNKEAVFLLPKYYQEVLDNNLFVNEHLEGYIKNKRGTAQVKKQIDEIVRSRKPFIESVFCELLLVFKYRRLLK